MHYVRSCGILRLSRGGRCILLSRRQQEKEINFLFLCVGSEARDISNLSCLPYTVEPIMKDPSIIQSRSSVQFSSVP